MSIPNLSEEAANTLQTVSNALLIAGSIAAVSGTIGAIWTQAVLGRYADTRLSTNELKTEQARKEAAQANEGQAKANAAAAGANAVAAQANERAAKLEKEAADSRLALEQLARQQAPRTMNAAQDVVFMDILARYRKRPIKVTVVSMQQEPLDYAMHIRGLLDRVGYADPEDQGLDRTIGATLNASNNAKVAICYFSPEEMKADVAANGGVCPLVAAFSAIGVPNATIPESSALGVRPGQVIVAIAEK